MPRREPRALACASACLALALLAAGCTARPSAPGPTPEPTATPEATSTPATPSGTPSPSSAEKPSDLSRLSITLVKKWSGLDKPLFLTNAGDGSGRLFVLEQTGRVRAIAKGTLLGPAYLDLSGQVSSGGERGLLGIAFSPRFERDGTVFVDYTDVNGDTVIARYVTADPSSSKPAWKPPTVLLHIKQPFPNHNGGCIAFGPDGYLYIGMGDGGSAGDPGNRAQTRDVLLGKLLRIDVSRSAGGKPYAIPATNPARASSAGPKDAPEVWAIGLRNPWRFSFDADGSLWVADVGQDAWEEIDHVTPAALRAAEKTGGLNFGWHAYEGDHAFPSGALVSPRARSQLLVWPIVEYPHPTGESITGGYVYRGARYPAMRGTYFYADFVKGWLGGVRLTDANGRRLATTQNRTLLQTKYQPASFGLDESGELYLVDLGGAVYAVTGSAK